MRLNGKRALVTGSDQGIGQSIAVRLAEDGADVAVNFRKNREGAQETAAQIEKLGRRAPVFQADVSKIADGRSLVAQAVEALGGVDILVNNAGIEKNASFVDVTEDDYRAVIEVNMSGPFFVTQAFAQHCRD